VSAPRTPVELQSPPPSGAGPDPAAGARAPGRPAAPERPAIVADGVKIVAWLSIAAGAIHAIAMIDHFSHWWAYGVFFMVLTYGQVLWGIGLLRKPTTDRNLVLGAYANLAIVCVWLYSRTIGVPLGPQVGPERVGTMDVAATLDQLFLAAYVAVIVRPDLRIRHGLRTLLGVHRMRIGMMICSATVFAGLLGGHHH
jgi:hypothetical protein